MVMNKLPDARDLDLLRTRMSTQFQIPSAYDDALSYQGLIYKLIQYLKDTMQNLEDWNVWLEDFVETFDTTLQNTVREKIQEMYDSGKIAELTAEILNVVQGQIDSIEDQIDTLGVDIDILKDRVFANPLDYGAFGDGVSNDTLPIQNCLNENDTVFIPNGVYNVKGVNIFKIRSNHTIIFESKNAVIKINDGNGNWQSVFYSDDMVENVVIKNGSIDCNVNNAGVTATNGWQNTGRIAIRIMLGKNIRVENMNFITDGFWTIRGMWVDGVISRNRFNYDVRSPYLGDYDVSSIWLGGKNNLIADNVFTSNSKTVNGVQSIGRTAIEFQGHYNKVVGNTVIGYRNGVILTNSTAYEKTELGVPEVGAKNNMVLNNRFINVQQGVNLWTMFTQGDEPTMHATVVRGNTFLLTKHSNTQNSFGVSIFRPLGSNYDKPEAGVANGRQNGAITDLTISDNRFESDVRYDAGYHALDLTPPVRMASVTISNNVIKNFKGCGLRMGHFYAMDGSVVVDENNFTTTDVNVIGNVFEDVYEPIRSSRNVSNVVVSGNVFRQVKTYPIGDNTVEIIKMTYASKFKAKNNVVDYPAEIQPFLPNMRTIYYNYGGLEIDDWNPKVVNELVSVEGRFSNYQQIGIYDLLKRVDGSYARSGSSFGTTLGTLPPITIVDIVINSGTTPSYIDVSDGSVVKMGDVLRSTTNVTNLNVFPVIAVENNRLYLGYHPSFASGFTKNNLIGQELSYTNSLVTV